MSSPAIEKKLQRPAFVVLRSSLLPFDVFTTWSEGAEAPRCVDDPERLEAAFLSDRKRLRERLSAFASMPEVREALFVASPEFHRALDRWREDPDSKKGKRAERTLVRYFARMCGRSTPFGLFAGHATVMAGDATDLRIDPRHTNRRHVRLDMDYLGSLVETLTKQPEIQDALLYRPNSSIRRMSGQLRYAESRLGERGRSYHFVAAGETDYLLETLQRAERGARLSDLADALVSDDVAREDSEAYVRELIATQLLVPDLVPKATGPEPARELLSDLRRHGVAGPVADCLQEVSTALEAMELEPPGIDVDRYRELTNRLCDLPAAVDPAKLFQVDLLKRAAHAKVGNDIFDAIERAITLMHGLRPESRNDDLSAFREAFRARYEDREVPLLEVLDEESGIGFGYTASAAEVSPLLEGLGLPRGQGRNTRRDNGPRWLPLDTFLLEKLNEVARNGSLVMRLAPEDLAPFRTRDVDPLPDAFHVIAEVAAKSKESLDAGDFEIAVYGAMGPSGASMFGRFCHGDPVLLAGVREHLAGEEALRPEAIFAEISHLPEGRVGNVILRPTLRNYEIPFLSRASVDDEFQIPVSDLLVSIDGQTVKLRSRRLGREVIPRHTNAYNVNRSALNAYRFLCALQHQGVAKKFGWNWGPIANARFLPRVMIGNLAVSFAQWKVSQSELREAVRAENDKRFAAVQRWRETRRMPRYVLLADADNTLPIDFENVLSVDTFVELVKGRRDFRIEELYPEPDLLGVSGPDGRYAHELIVPFVVQRTPTAAASPARMIEQTSPIQRTFMPGSEWLYAKIYAGTGTVDDLLRNAIAPLVRGLQTDGSIDGWFFIRYGDPEWHLRVRFHGDPNRLAHDVLPRLQASCAADLEAGLIWKVQLDTYEREIERYGRGEDMLLAERLFQIDSEAALQIFEAYSGDAFSDVRWRLALRGVDQLLDDLGFDLERKMAIVSANRNSLNAEFHARPSLEHQLGERFRKERAVLQKVIDRHHDETSVFADGLAALNRRSTRLIPVASALNALSAEGRLTTSLQALASSYIHMHVNRVLRSAHRAQELVMYDFLARIYKSQRARATGMMVGERA